MQRHRGRIDDGRPARQILLASVLLQIFFFFTWMHKKIFFMYADVCRKIVAASVACYFHCFFCNFVVVATFVDNLNAGVSVVAAAYAAADFVAEALVVVAATSSSVVAAFAVFVSNL